MFPAGQPELPAVQKWAASSAGLQRSRKFPGEQTYISKNGFSKRIAGSRSCVPSLTDVCDEAVFAFVAFAVVPGDLHPDTGDLDPDAGDLDPDIGDNADNGKQGQKIARGKIKASVKKRETNASLLLSRQRGAQNGPRDMTLNHPAGVIDEVFSHSCSQG